MPRRRDCCPAGHVYGDGSSVSKVERTCLSGIACAATSSAAIPARTRVYLRTQRRGVANVSGTVDPVRPVDYGGGFPTRDALPAQARFEVVGNPLGSPAPGEVVADVVCLLNESGLCVRRPVKADAPQRRQVGVVLPTRIRDPGASYQCGTAHRANGERDQSAMCSHRFLFPSVLSARPCGRRPTLRCGRADAALPRCQRQTPLRYRLYTSGSLISSSSCRFPFSVTGSRRRYLRLSKISHKMAGAFFSSLWRILEPYGRAVRPRVSLFEKCTSSRTPISKRRVSGSPGPSDPENPPPAMVQNN